MVRPSLTQIPPSAAPLGEVSLRPLLHKPQSPHLDDDHSRCVLQQVALASPELLSEQEASAESLQAEHQALAASPLPPTGVQA